MEEGGKGESFIKLEVGGWGRDMGRESRSWEGGTLLIGGGGGAFHILPQKEPIQKHTHTQTSCRAIHLHQFQGQAGDFLSKIREEAVCH